mgnify:CR=1 FL=1
MKVNYNGFKLDAHRDRVLLRTAFDGGRPERLYYVAIRDVDGFILDEGSVHSSVKIHAIIAGLKFRVDEYIRTGDDSPNVPLCPL